MEASWEDYFEPTPSTSKESSEPMNVPEWPAGDNEFVATSNECVPIDWEEVLDPKEPITPFYLKLPPRGKKRSYLPPPKFDDGEEEEPPLMKCFLIRMEDHSDFVNVYGTPGKADEKRRKLGKFRIEGTEKGRSKYTKLTIFANDEEEMNEAVEALRERRQQVDKEKKLLYPMFWKEIDPNHCTICYRPGHQRADCKNCGWCTKKGHQRFECPERTIIDHQHKPRVTLLTTADPTTLPNDPVKLWKIKKHQALSERRKRFFKTVVERKPWFQKPGIVVEAVINKMKPIGPPDNPKNTFALDTEGGGGGFAGNVHVSAWCGTHGVQTVFFTTIKQFLKQKQCLSTPISGIQAPDVLQRSDERTIVKQILLSIFEGARVLYHGGGDMNILGISANDCLEHRIEVFNTQDLFEDFNGLPIGLATHDKFWYHGRTLRREGNQRTSPINGHSPERDSRLTLKIYRKYHQFKEKYGIVPTGDEIRKSKRGYFVEDWLKDHRLF